MPVMRMLLPRQGFHALIGLLVTVLAVLSALPDERARLLQSFEYWLYDLRVAATASDSSDARVVLVDIDERSLSEVGDWPWERDLIAGLTEQLFDYYAAGLVAYDAIFTEPDRSSAVALLDELHQHWLQNDPRFSEVFRAMRPLLDWDRQFARTLSEHTVLLGYHFNPEGHSSGSLTDPPPLAAPAPADLPLYEPRGHTGSYWRFTRSAQGGGFVSNPAISEDGVHRRMPLLQRYRGDVYESLALAVVRMLHGARPLRLEFGDGRLRALGFGGFRVPVDARAQVMLPFRGREGSYPYVSAVDVLKGMVPPQLLRDAIVLVGSSAASEGGLVATPLQTFYPRLEVQANLISGLLDGTTRVQPPEAHSIELAVLAMVGLLLSAWLPGRSPLKAGAICLAAICIVTVLNAYLWLGRDLVVPLAAAYLLIATLFLVHQALDYARERQLKASLEQRFGRYVPPTLVRRMAEVPERDLGIAGDTRDMTVLFADLRGFSRIAERMPPHELTRFMHEWLTPVTAIVHRYQGTVDKYMGDCIMAFWGAPLRDPEHTRHALQAAIAILQEVQRLNRRFRRRGWPALRLGIGMHCGEMHVGDMGSRYRTAYTVLGDAVNLGSRLEGLTRHYGVPLIVSAAVRERVPEYCYLELDRVRVKGKLEPVVIYQPLGLARTLPLAREADLTLYRQALAHYLRQEWNDAERCLRLLARRPRLKRLAGIYQERVRYYRCQPPPADWDGVFTHLEK